MNNKISIFLVILLVGFPQLSETIYTPALPTIAHALTTSESLVEMTLSIYFIGFALGVTVWGYLADLIGRRPAMLTGLAVYTIACLLCQISGSIAELLIWRVLQAFGASVGSVVTQTILRDTLTGSERHRVFAIVSAALAFVPAIGPLFGGILTDFFGWRSNFVFLTFIGFGLLIKALFKLPETRPQSSTPIKCSTMLQLAARMVRDGELWRSAMIIAACNGVIFGYYGEAPFLYINLLNFSSWQYGLTGVLIASASLSSALLSPVLSRWCSPAYLALIGGRIGVTGACLLILTTIQIGCSAVALIAASVLFFFGIGLILPFTLSRALENYRSEIGSASALLSLLYYLLIALLVEGMTLLHAESPLPMAIYFLALFASAELCMNWSACANFFQFFSSKIGQFARGTSSGN